jgi:hypothetical protein
MNAAARRGLPSLDDFNVNLGNAPIALVNLVTHELAALKFEDSGLPPPIFCILLLLSIILGIDNTSYPPTSNAEFLHVLLNYTTETL